MNTSHQEKYIQGKYQEIKNQIEDVRKKSTSGSGIDVLNLIDQSGSIGQEKFDQLRLALNQFFYAFNLTKDGDKIALLKFDDVCDIKSPKYLVSNFSYDKEDMSNKMISTDYKAGGTSTKLAIEQSLILFQSTDQSRGKLLIIWTDEDLGGASTGQIIKDIQGKNNMNIMIFFFNIPKIPSEQDLLSTYNLTRFQVQHFRTIQELSLVFQQFAKDKPQSTFQPPVYKGHVVAHDNIELFVGNSPDGQLEFIHVIIEKENKDKQKVVIVDKMYSTDYPSVKVYENLPKDEQLNLKFRGKFRGKNIFTQYSIEEGTPFRKENHPFFPTNGWIVFKLKDPLAQLREVYQNAKAAEEQNQPLDHPDHIHNKLVALYKKIQEFQLPKELQELKTSVLNIILSGLCGHGKSSLINTFDTIQKTIEQALHNPEYLKKIQYSSFCTTGKQDTTLTKDIKKVNICGESRSIVTLDTPGIEKQKLYNNSQPLSAQVQQQMQSLQQQQIPQQNQQQQQQQQNNFKDSSMEQLNYETSLYHNVLPLILDGNIQDGFDMFDPKGLYQNAFKKEVNSMNDRVHGILFVYNCQFMNEEAYFNAAKSFLSFYQNYKDQTGIQIGYQPFVILTNVDQLLRTMLKQEGKDLPDVNFREIVLDYYPRLQTISKHFAEKLKIDEGQVFFFNNYTSSTNPRDIYKEYMGLYILDKAIESAKSKIESLYSQMYYKAIVEEAMVKVRCENYKPVYELRQTQFLELIPKKDYFPGTTLTNLRMKCQNILRDQMGKQLQLSKEDLGQFQFALKNDTDDTNIDLVDEKLENNYNIEKVIYKRKNMDQFKIILPITIKKIQGISEEPAENDQQKQYKQSQLTQQQAQFQSFQQPNQMFQQFQFPPQMQFPNVGGQMNQNVQQQQMLQQMQQMFMNQNPYIASQFQQMQQLQQQQQQYQQSQIDSSFSNIQINPTNNSQSSSSSNINTNNNTNNNQVKQSENNDDAEIDYSIHYGNNILEWGSKGNMTLSELKEKLKNDLGAENTQRLKFVSYQKDQKAFVSSVKEPKVLVRDILKEGKIFMEYIQ